MPKHLSHKLGSAKDTLEKGTISFVVLIHESSSITRTATCLNPFLILAKVAFRDIWGESRREGLSVVGAHVDLLVLLSAHRDRLAVVVDLPPVLALRPAGVDPGVEENLKRKLVQS